MAIWVIVVWAAGMLFYLALNFVGSRKEMPAPKESK